MEQTTHLEQGIHNGTPTQSEKLAGEACESATLDSPERALEVEIPLDWGLDTGVNGSETGRGLSCDSEE